MTSTSTTDELLLKRQRSIPPLIEIAIQSIFLIALSFLTVYDLQFGPRWVHPCGRLGILVSSVIGVFVGCKENQLSTADRIFTVVPWCVFLSATCAIYIFIYPVQKIPGEPISLGRNYPFTYAIIGFFSLSVMFSVIGVIVEVVVAFACKGAS